MLMPRWAVRTSGEHVYMIGVFFFFQAEDGIRDVAVTGVQTCALPISPGAAALRCARDRGRARQLPDQDLEQGRGDGPEPLSSLAVWRGAGALRAGGVARRRAGAAAGQGGACRVARTHRPPAAAPDGRHAAPARSPQPRSEEHTSELQSRLHLVCRLLLEKKKK